jgi:hypothetical protein
MIIAFTLSRLQADQNQNYIHFFLILTPLLKRAHLLLWAVISTSACDHNAQEKLLKQ